MKQMIRERTHRLDVPAATKDEAVAMLSYHRQRLEAGIRASQ